ncbi:copper chaperone PCu(A)C [Parasulfitobacter algicola]|uniref:Copper chaperone PCu(A)C n=1 Tax=Parasulfitobacter algicola TaxID=2614809 RepID=A0ABX2J056_9RHOB|nr:copper chaperone PCu(A)C [Sulfitobacter algicola]NSX56078.1 copper chaperone PCu(A)C [Sulfitobacter algicola]
MKRIIAVALMIGAGLTALYMTGLPKSDIVLSNARAVQIDGRPNMFVVTMTIQNDGGPAVLSSVSSPQAMSVSLMNPLGGDGPFVVPGGTTSEIAMDGAHVMLMTDGQSFSEGSLLPMVVTFADYGDVSTQVLNATADVMTMNHSAANGVQVPNTPTVAIFAPEGMTADGGELLVETDNFVFRQAAEMVPHVDNEGHAHVYLNGLKLGRLYGSTMQIGPLRPGQYTLLVSLNTNDHRPYVDDTGAVSDTLTFEIP